MVDINNIPSLLNHILGFKDKQYEYEEGYMGDGPISRLIKREVLKKITFDETSIWNEDTLWNIKLFYNVKSVCVCSSLWYIYSVRINSVTQCYRTNCPCEFEEIIEKECKMGETLWENLVEKGIYYRVWHDIFFLSRTYIFHKKNNCNYKDRYSILKCALTNNYYQDSLYKVDFSRESRNLKRAVKKMLNQFMKLHLYVFVYLIIMIYIKRANK